jgi:hypothetical protein
LDHYDECGLNASLREADGDAEEFLNWPPDQGWRGMAVRGFAFWASGDVRALRITTIMAKASMTSET